MLLSVLFLVLLLAFNLDALPLDENLEIVNGLIVDDPAELPFLCRIQIHGSFPPTSHFCGVALISADYGVTAKHCVDDFYDICLEVEDCYVACRDLNRAGHDVGQFRVSILEVFFKSGISDIAVIQLKEKVHEHKDYDQGVPIVPVVLASEEPRPGDEVLTAGWGVTGYNKGPSEQLRKLKLNVTSVDKLLVKTAVTNSNGTVSDPCKGDSGGPLLVWKQDHWEIIGTLKVRYATKYQFCSLINIDPNPLPFQHLVENCSPLKNCTIDI